MGQCVSETESVCVMKKVTVCVCGVQRFTEVKPLNPSHCVCACV